MTLPKERRSGPWSRACAYVCSPLEPPNMLLGFRHCKYSCLQYLKTEYLKCPNYKAIWRSCQVSWKKSGGGYQSLILLMGLDQRKQCLVLSFTRACSNEGKESSRGQVFVLLALCLILWNRVSPSSCAPSGAPTAWTQVRVLVQQARYPVS